MRETVELSSLDLRYEGHRLRDDAREARLAGVDRRAGHRRAAGTAWTRRRPASCWTASNATARPRSWESIACPTFRWAQEEASGHPEPDAGSTDKGLEHSGAGPVRRRSVDHPRHERGGGCRDALAQQGLGLHAAASAGRDEPGDSRRFSSAAAFPVYSYMYTLRPFMRMNAVAPASRSSSSSRPWPASG